jgi:uncharacterized membrane protein
VLEDQTLNSTIVVRAIDNAGQVREESFTPMGENSHNVSEKGLVLSIIGGVIAFLLSIAVTIRLRRHRKHSS